MSDISRLEVIIESTGAQAVVSDLTQVQNAQDNVKKSSGGTAEALKDMGEGATDLIEPVGGLSSILGDLDGIVTLVIDSVLEVAKAFGEILEMAEEGAGMQRVLESSGTIARTMGADIDAIMNTLRESSLGMVSDLELAQSASRAMMLGVSADAEQLGQLMEVAAARGRIMGINTTQSFDDIVRGLGRLSPHILDNLGIIIDAKSTYDAYAESIGKSANELTKAEKTQALLNKVILESQPLLAQTGGLVVDNAGKWEQMHAAKANYFNSLKMDLAEGMSWWAEYWAGVFNQTVAGANLNHLVKEANQLGINTDAIQAAYKQYGLYGGARADLVNYAPELIATLQAEVDAFHAAEEANISWYDANYEGVNSQKLLEESLANVTAAYAETIAEMEHMAKIQEALSNANLELDIAIKAFHKSVGDDLVKGLRDAGLEGEELEKRLGILDELMGTSYVMEYQLELATDELLDELINNPDGFAAKFAVFDNEFTPLQKSVQAAMEKVGDLEQALKDLEKTYNIKVNLTVTGSLPSGIGYSPGGGISGTPNALGGPVYPGEAYLVGERGPEPFIPNVPGQIISNSDYVSMINGTTNSTLEIDYKRLGRALSESIIEAAESGRLGNTYINTSGNKYSNASTDFEILRAYGGNF